MTALQEMLHASEQWFGEAVAKLMDAPAPRGHGIVLGCPLWGDKYVERFKTYGLPTLTAPKNLQALRYRARLVLFTDRPSFIALWNATRDLERQGVEVLLPLIPLEVMQLWNKHETNKYWVLGTAQNIALQMCARWKMGFHMVMPDHMHGPRYFENLFRLLTLGKRAIAQTGISADITTAGPEIERWRDADGHIAIPDRDLCDIAWRHLHPQMQACVMSPGRFPDAMPNSHFLIWPGADRLHLYSPHMNAVYISPELCQRAQPRIPATLDAELPSFMPQDFYVPTIEDGLGFVEVSDSEKPADAAPVPFPAFAERALSQVNFSTDFMPFFQRCCEVPIHRAFMTPDEIKAEHRAVLQKLVEMNPPGVARTLLQRMTPGRKNLPFTLEDIDAG